MCAFTNYYVPLHHLYEQRTAAYAPHCIEDAYKVEKKFNELDIDTIPSICYSCVVWCAQACSNYYLFFFKKKKLKKCGAWNSATRMGKYAWREAAVETPQAARDENHIKVVCAWWWIEVVIIDVHLSVKICLTFITNQFSTLHLLHWLSPALLLLFYFNYLEYLKLGRLGISLWFFKRALIKSDSS